MATRPLAHANKSLHESAVSGGDAALKVAAGTPSAARKMSQVEMQDGKGQPTIRMALNWLSQSPVSGSDGRRAFHTDASGAASTIIGGPCRGSPCFREEAVRRIQVLIVTGFHAGTSCSLRPPAPRCAGHEDRPTCLVRWRWRPKLPGVPNFNLGLTERRMDLCGRA